MIAAIQKKDDQSFRDLITSLGIPTKRGCSILSKWSKRGWYDYGVSIDLGWLEEAGKQAIGVILVDYVIDVMEYSYKIKQKPVLVD